MSEKHHDSSRGDDEVRMDSLNTDIIVLDGPVDTTVRPMDENLRRILEQKGVIKRRPQAPETPPTSSDAPP
jgi:hypothetical protein